jgi:hypothetical protein
MTLCLILTTREVALELEYILTLTFDRQFLAHAEVDRSGKFSHQNLMDFARRFVSADNEWNNKTLAQLSLQYPYQDLFAATEGFSEKNKIGTGSYGAVFRGTMADGTEVAIKVIDLPSEAGFEDEVRPDKPSYRTIIGQSIIKIPSPESGYTDGLCSEWYTAFIDL